MWRRSVFCPSVSRGLFRNHSMVPGIKGSYLSDIFSDFFSFFFLNFQFSILYDFFSFSLTWDPMGAKISNSYISLSSDFNQSFVINIVVMWEYRLLLFWRSVKHKQIWHFEIIVSTWPYGAGNFKTLLILAYFSCNLNQSLWGHCLLWRNVLGYRFFWQSGLFFGKF